MHVNHAWINSQKNYLVIIQETLFLYSFDKNATNNIYEINFQSKMIIV